MDGGGRGLAGHPERWVLRRPPLSLMPVPLPLDWRGRGHLGLWCVNATRVALAGWSGQGGGEADDRKVARGLDAVTAPGTPPAPRPGDRRTAARRTPRRRRSTRRSRGPAATTTTRPTPPATETHRRRPGRIARAGRARRRRTRTRTSPPRTRSRRRSRPRQRGRPTRPCPSGVGWGDPDRPHRRMPRPSGAHGPRPRRGRASPSRARGRQGGLLGSRLEEWTGRGWVDG